MGIPDDKKQLFGKISGWCGVVASVCAFILWILRLTAEGAYIEWNYRDFLGDSGRFSWRNPVFSFMPSTLLDVWTPFIFGLLGLSIHVKDFPFGQRLAKLKESWPRYFGFHLLMAFFGGIGYGGDVGIILGAIQMTVAVILFVAIFICDGSPSLDMDVKAIFSFKIENKAGKLYLDIVAWTSLVASVLVVILGVFRICASGAHLVWNDYNAVSDTNRLSWRMPLFSLTPDVLADSWTPLAMGCIGALFHIKGAPRISWFCAKYWRFFIYHFVMGMVGCIGYVGNLGILFSSIVFLACLLQFVAAFLWKDEVKCIEGHLNANLSMRGKGGNVQATGNVGGNDGNWSSGTVEAKA